MIREDRFLISRKPYAVDLASFRTMEREPGRNWAWYTIDAVWFRRRRGETVACVGTLRDIVDDPAPATVEEFLHRFDDGRYGGDTEGRWDSESYWGTGTPSPTRSSTLRSSAPCSPTTRPCPTATTAGGPSRPRDDGRAAGPRL